MMTESKAGLGIGLNIAVLALGVWSGCGSGSQAPGAGAFTEDEGDAIAVGATDRGLGNDGGLGNDANGADEVSLDDATIGPTLGDAAEGRDAAAEAAPSSDCPILSTNAVPPRGARSAGFTGTTNAYFMLYNVACQSVSDCAAACTAAGGTASSCSAGSDCVVFGQEGSKQCL